MKRKTIIWRIVVEIIIFLAVFSAVDSLTWPSDSTDVAVQEAVNKKELSPACMVEVHSAIRSASFIRILLFVIQVATVFLICSDGWALWQSRRKA
jgi:hypothetical protein